MPLIAFTLAFRNVLRRRERSLLTLVGVLLAVGAFVAMISLAEGMYKRVELELDGRHVDVYVVPATAAPLPTGPVGTIGLTTDTINLEWVKRIRDEVDNVRAATPVARMQWSIKRRMIMVIGIDPEQITTFLPSLKWIQGRPGIADGCAVVGKGLLDMEGLAMGSRLRSGQTEYPITGVVSAGAGFQDYFAYVPMSTALKVSDGKGAAEIWIQLRDEHRSAEVIRKIESMKIPRVKVLSRKEYLGSANDYIQYAWMLQFAISAIGVLIAVTAAMNTMLMSTYERMREFGTLRAIGASRVYVLWLVLV